jgi:RNA polymerase sigma factor (sigma-70 family)
MGAAVPASVTAAGRRRRLVLSRRETDEHLARAATAGDAGAFERLYERYRQPLYAYCRSLVRHEEDALDALQSTFALAWSALQRDRRHAPVRPWLFRIAHNESVTVLRRRMRQPTTELEESCTPPAPSAAEDAGRRADWELLMQDLAELPDRTRSALLLREMSGLSHEEIAMALETTVGAAKQAILEARKALAEMTEGRAMACKEIQARLSAGDRRALRGRRLTAHMRGCATCRAFAEAIDTRSSLLRAYAPVLPLAAAETLLTRILPHAAAHAAGSAGSAGAASGGLAAARLGMTGKAAGLSATWKAVGVAIVAAGASAGGVAVHHAVESGPVSPASAAATHLPAHSSAARRASHRAGVAGGMPAGATAGRTGAAGSAKTAAGQSATGSHGHGAKGAGASAHAPAIAAGAPSHLTTSRAAETTHGRSALHRHPAAGFHVKIPKLRAAHHARPLHPLHPTTGRHTTSTTPRIHTTPRPTRTTTRSSATTTTSSTSTTTTSTTATTDTVGSTHRKTSN